MICRKLEQCADSVFAGEIQVDCDNNRKKCIESSDTRSLVKCGEHNKSYILNNTKRQHVILYKMDGGVIVVDRDVPEGIDKCDYLYVINGNGKTAILTELKGKLVSKAIKQIHETLEIYKDYFQKFSHVYGRVIVASSTPNLKASPEYVNLEKKLRKNYRGNLKIEERQYTEKDTDLL